MIIIGRPNINDAPSWYASFFNEAIGDNLIEALQRNKQETLDLIGAIPASREDFAYADHKWTIKQVFIHMVDEERYYTYKAFCYSRQVNCQLEVPQGISYDKDFNAGNRTLKDIRSEFIAVRDALISLFSTMTTDMLDFKDFTGQKDVYTARSIGWFAVGHNAHHCRVIRDKYLAPVA